MTVNVSGVSAGASIISGAILSSSLSVTANVVAEAAVGGRGARHADPLEAVHAVPTRSMPIAAAAIDQRMCRIVSISFRSMGASVSTLGA